MEVWKPIPEWESLYEVSDLGRVKSKGRCVLARNPWGKLTPRNYKPKVMALGNTPKGYLLVTFISNGKREYFYVHRLVLLAFVGPCPIDLEVCHNNGKRDDNRLINLRYDTRSANALDRHVHGTLPNWFGEEVPRSKLKESDIILIREMAGKISPRKIGEMFDVHRSTISNILSGKAWGHVK